MIERRAIAVRGTVQGVGFRPFVYGLASRLNLAGFVRNASGEVRIEIEGDSEQLDRFLSDIKLSPPPLARIDDLIWEQRSILGQRAFHIQESSADPSAQIVIAPDAATCAACVAELFDPNNRRYRYPFLNCTDCGPRLTIVTGAPYDRARTTMAAFEMCPACQAEYENPLDRRFHAQPTACAICGPRLSVADSTGADIGCDDPLNWFIEQLRAGRIGAMKGLGGYHLVCDARNVSAVAELRRRKHRDEKPFAIMVGTLEDAEKLCEISAFEQELLTSWRRPIVLLRKHLPTDLADAVAPGNPTLGVMLPYTPLHHLLMAEMENPLVMTSGNRADEPIAINEPEVFESLEGIADVFLTHNRPIHVRCDDSVTRAIGTVESPLRRSRGYAPRPIRLPIKCDARILAVGAQLKGTFALSHGDHAIMSHHLGDLDHFQAYHAFEKDIALFEELFEIQPQYIAHDLHPDYASTQYARKRAAAKGIKLIAIQHHHAHMASCMAEHGIDEPVIGVSFDGTGYGTDGAIWGGEFLVGDYKSFERMAHLRYVAMPGGDQAIKEPWRIALAHLVDAGIDCVPLQKRIGARAISTVLKMVRTRFNSPLTSSAGRLFDAVASIAGVRDRVSYEGQAAMELEWLGAGEEPNGCYPFEISNSKLMEIDTRPTIRGIMTDVGSGVPAKVIARRFHSTLIDMIMQTCVRLREMTHIEKVVLSGGVFMNALLHFETNLQLRKFGFCPFQHSLVPANDGGISLGQLAIAARQIGVGSCV